MQLSEAPCWGSFTFTYKGVQIYVPTFLNNVARYKPDSFWDWLIFVRYPGQSAVAFVYDTMGEEENYQNQKLNPASPIPRVQHINHVWFLECSRLFQGHEQYGLQRPGFHARDGHWESDRRKGNWDSDSLGDKSSTYPLCRQCIWDEQGATDCISATLQP